MVDERKGRGRGKTLILLFTLIFLCIIIMPFAMYLSIPCTFPNFFLKLKWYLIYIYLAAVAALYLPGPRMGKGLSARICAG